MTKQKKARLTVTDTEGENETHEVDVVPVEESENKIETHFNWTAERAVKAEVPTVALRCVWHTRLVIRADMTPSGTRYEFMPGEVRSDVNPKDRRYLLGLEKVQPPGCCGGVANPPSLKYFVEV